MSAVPSVLYNMRSAIESGDIGRVGEALMNDLQASAVALHPEIARAMKALESAGARSVLMSGSGSTVFGLVPDEAQGRKTAAILEADGFWARCVRTVVR